MIGAASALLTAGTTGWSRRTRRRGIPVALDDETQCWVLAAAKADERRCALLPVDIVLYDARLCIVELILQEQRLEAREGGARAQVEDGARLDRVRFALVWGDRAVDGIADLGGHQR